MVALNCGPYPFVSGMNNGQSEALRFQVLRHQMAQVTIVVHYQKTWVDSLCHALCAVQGLYLREPQERLVFMIPLTPFPLIPQPCVARDVVLANKHTNPDTLKS